MRIKHFLSWLFSPTSTQSSVWQVIVWREKRRIAYNAILGVFGILSLALFFFFIKHSGHLKPGEDAVEPFAIILAPFVANVCYTLGWIGEIFCLKVLHRDVPSLGPKLLKAGLVFSPVVAYVPSVIWGATYLVGLVKH